MRLDVGYSVEDHPPNCLVVANTIVAFGQNSTIKWLSGVCKRTHEHLALPAIIACLEDVQEQLNNGRREWGVSRYRIVE